MLAAHAANALYATLAQDLLNAREGEFYANISV